MGPFPPPAIEGEGKLKEHKAAITWVDDHDDIEKNCLKTNKSDEDLL